MLIGGVAAGALSPPAASTSPHSLAKTTEPISTQGTIANHPPVSIQTFPGVNNSFRRHRDPGTVVRANRLEDLQRVLRDRLETQLSASAVDISQGRYNQAQSRLGQAYLNQLEKYADVTNERNDDSATSTIKTLNETRTRQREYAQTVEEFRRKYTQYQQAKRRGNDERARQIARKVADLGEQAQQQAKQLNESYNQYNTTTGANVTTAREQIQEVQADVNQNRQSVEQREFIPTTITVDQADTQGSFVDPIVIRAKLIGGDSPVSNRNISLVIGNQMYTATTNINGEFSVQYRPITIPSNTSTVTVAYLPANSSVYTGSRVSIPIEVERVTGQITIDSVTSETAFNDPITVNGTVTVADEPVSGLSLTVLVDDQRLGTVVTAPDGSFTFRRRLPAGPNVGEQTVMVRTQLTGRSVSATSAARSIQIRGTPTSLSATAMRDEEVIQVSGQLVADASPLPGRQIIISADDELIGTVRTKANGSYVVRIDEAELDRTVVVKFNGAGTNLNSTETSVLVSPSQDARTGIDPGTDPDSPDTPREFVRRIINDLTRGGFTLGNTDASLVTALLSSPIVLVGGGITLGLCGSILVIVRRQRRPADNSSDATMSSDSPAPTNSAEHSTVDLSALLRSVEAELESGNHSEAIIQAYVIARSALANKQDVDQVRTHWQFFETCVANGVDNDALQMLTKAYERARYGEEEVPLATAKTAFSAARFFVESDSGSHIGQSRREEN